MTSLVLSQRAWRARSAHQDLHGLVAAAAVAAKRRQVREAPVLLLLATDSARGRTDQPPSESSVMTALGALAAQSGVWLAGAAKMLPSADAAPATIAFLIDSDGKLRLRAEKITPELLLGFDDSTSALGRPGAFAVASTPFGQIGLLPGEDILYSHNARALVFNGAELILNPSVERSDDQFEIRQVARLARAGENCCYVATASPNKAWIADDVVDLPGATALYGPVGPVVAARGSEDFVHPDYDLELLRRARVNPQRSFPAIVRANLYARGYRRDAGRANGTAPATVATPPRTAAEWRAEAIGRLEARALQPSRHRSQEEQYEVLMVQNCARLIPLDRTVDAASLIQLNLREALALAASRANIPSVRVVMFPEFWLTGPGGIGGVQRTVDDMARLAISFPGPVFDRIAAFAQEHKVYVAFQNFEVDGRMPGRVFNTAFLIDDAGNLVHRYRKNQCADVWGLLPDTTPGSVLTQYLDVFGEESLFPVADTPLGRLANMICFDNMLPEVAHGLRRAGAEVILHLSSEPHGAGRIVWDSARRIRAFENGCYLLSVIDGGEHLAHDSDVLTFFRRGHSRIVRFDGSVEGTVDGPGPVAFRVAIDLAALRRARQNPFTNLALWDDPAVYAQAYSGDVGLPNDLWSGDPAVNPYASARELRRRISSYLDRGVYVAPAVPNARSTIPDAV
jgi:deaminated glutathione amidase